MSFQSPGPDERLSRGFWSRSPLRAFVHPQFRLLWAASLGSIMSFFMVMLARGWLILELTDSPFLVTAVQAVSMLPMMVLPPFGGVIADRLDRRAILIASEAANLLIVLLLVLLLFTELVQVWHVFVLALLNGVTFALTMPARAASVPDVVSDERDIANGVALWGSIFSYASLIGPALAGYLLSIDPDQFGWAFLGAAFILVPAIGFLLPLRLPQKATPTEEASETSVLGSIGEGFTYIRASGFLMGLMLLGLIFSVFCMPYQALLPVFARDILGAGPDGLGLLGAAGGAGAILGSIVLAVYSNPPYMRAFMLGGGLGFGLLAVLFALSTVFPISVALALGLGFLTQLFMTGSTTLVQVTVSPSIRGRVLGIRYLVMGLGPAGILLLGFGAETLGADLALGVMGIIAIVLMVSVTMGIPELRKRQGEAIKPAVASVTGDE